MHRFVREGGGGMRPRRAPRKGTWNVGVVEVHIGGV